MKHIYPILALLLIAVVIWQELPDEQFSATRTAPTNPILDYKSARSVLWQSLYPKGGATLYCQQQFFMPHGSGINVEHVFPMSWVTKALNCGTRAQCRRESDVFNQIEADLHNLYPARSDVNSARSSFRFAEIVGESRRFGASCDFEVDRRARVVEPMPSIRGDIARSMFYMAFQYKAQGLRIYKAQGRLLANWHRVDPPSVEERARNEKIARLQKNDNPFISTPEVLDAYLQKQAFY